MSEPVDVAAIREALDKATPGEWLAYSGHDEFDGDLFWDVTGPQIFNICRADAELIVLLRNNAEALLAALEGAA